jgi:hypothetical protein
MLQQRQPQCPKSHTQWSRIEAIAIEVKAIGYDEDNDETSSNDDPDAEMQLYARAFQAWADGKIRGTAEEIFDAVNAVLED